MTSRRHRNPRVVCELALTRLPQLFRRHQAARLSTASTPGCLSPEHSRQPPGPALPPHQAPDTPMCPEGTICIPVTHPQGDQVQALSHRAAGTAAASDQPPAHSDHSMSLRCHSSRSPAQAFHTWKCPHVCVATLDCGPGWALSLLALLHRVQGLVCRDRKEREGSARATGPCQPQLPEEPHR